MNDDQLDDLKQFIDSRISQTELGLKSEIHELDSKVQKLTDEVRDGFAGVGEAIEEINQRLDRRDKEVDQRLTNLEHQVAA